MKPNPEKTRRNLGELAVMQRQTDDMERRILERAEARLSDVEAEIKQARVAAMTGDDDAKAHYTALVEERGKLNQVIASARSALN